MKTFKQLSRTKLTSHSWDLDLSTEDILEIIQRGTSTAIQRVIYVNGPSLEQELIDILWQKPGYKYKLFLIKARAVTDINIIEETYDKYVNNFFSSEAKSILALQSFLNINVNNSNSEELKLLTTKIVGDLIKRRQKVGYYYIWGLQMVLSFYKISEKSAIMISVAPNVPPQMRYRALQKLLYIDK